MPDLVTHLATALVPGLALRADRAACLALGVSLPDLGGRVPGIGLTLLQRAGVPVVDEIGHAFGVLHQPVGAAIGVALVSYLFPERARPGVVVWLYAGVVIHLVADVLQDYRGYGHPLGYPFTAARFEWGLFGPEATVPWALPLLAATAALWAIRLWRARRR